MSETLSFEEFEEKRVPPDLKNLLFQLHGSDEHYYRIIREEYELHRETKQNE